MLIYNKLRFLYHLWKLFVHYPAKSFFQRFKVLFDYLHLRRVKGLTPEEYELFRLFERSETFRHDFLGENEQRYYLDLLNPTNYYIVARNKYLAHKILDAAGVPMATLYGYYDPMAGRSGDNIARTPEEMLHILKSQNVQECVIKTTETSHGNNVQVLRQINYDSGMVTLHSGEEQPFSAIVGSKPLIFERCLRQTAQLSAINASSVNTVRFMTLLYPDGSVKIPATFIKIGRAGRCVDNAGAGGNVDASIDTETGIMEHAIRFDGWEHIADVDVHPDSGAPINGVQIEHWSEICQKVKEFQQVFPFVKAAGWDIALTEEGPCVVEVNDMWDRTGQLFIQRGWRPEIRDCFLAWQKNNLFYEFGRLTNELPVRKLKRIVSQP